MKKTIVFCVTLLLCQATLLHAKEVKLTTYYPSPYGEYKKLTATDSVGIGTTDPKEALEVRGNLYLNFTDTSMFDEQHIYFKSHNLYIGNRVGDWAHSNVHIRSGGADGDYDLVSTLTLYDTTASTKNPVYTSKIQLVSTGTSYLNGGNVGIGTATPAGPFHVYDGDSNSGTQVYIDAGKGGTLKQATINLLTQGTGAKGFDDLATRGWHISARGSSYAPVAQQNDLGIWYWDGNTYNLSMYFDSLTRSVDINGGLDVYGAIRAKNAVIENAPALSSDITLKKDVTTIPDALSKVSALRGVNYRWKDPKEDQRLRMGVIAQETEKVFPNMVATDKKGLKTVEYDQFIPVLIEAVKEQQKQIESLKAEVAKLQKQ